MTQKQTAAAHLKVQCHLIKQNATSDVHTVKSQQLCVCGWNSNQWLIYTLF